MSAYKKLKREDSFITAYTAHKSFTASGSQHSALGIETYIGISGSGDFLPNGSDLRLEGTDYEHYSRLVYNSIHHLYYSGFENGQPTTGSEGISGSAFENYLQSSYTSNQRRAQDSFTVFSIPQNLYGVNIKPGSVRIVPDIEGSGSNYMFTSSDATGNFVTESFIEEVESMYGGVDVPQDGDYVFEEGTYINETEGEFITPGFDDFTTALVDDGNGNLILEESTPNRVVGNIMYSHGLIIITNPVVGAYYSNYFSGSLSWQSSQPIYTYNYHCPIQEEEFNFTQHPSALTGSNGVIADNVTGSFFTPYVTTVGLYNDANELIAVGKMAQPIPISDNNETTVVVKLDI
jgi:hypothetical protein|tara:strand:- start:7965 stop:9008 length:1044 start_codon:yes stop_codon:yes gene_type:complete